MVILRIAVFLLLSNPLISLSQSCPYDPMTIIKDKISKIAEGSGNRCLKLGTQGVPLATLAECYKNTPPNIEVLVRVDELISEYKTLSKPCDASFQLTYLGLLEQRGQSCAMFNARDRHPELGNNGDVARRIAQSGQQCLADLPSSSAADNQITLGAWIAYILKQSESSEFTKWRKSMLFIWFESFSYLPTPVRANTVAPSRATTATDIALRIQKTSQDGSPQWREFLQEVQQLL